MVKNVFRSCPKDSFGEIFPTTLIVIPSKGIPLGESRFLG